MDDYSTALATPDAGGQQYAQESFNTAQRTLAPQFAHAINQSRQNAANSGLGSSPMGLLGTNQLEQQHQNNLFGAAQEAGMQGANVNEENARSAMARQFAQQQLEREQQQQTAMQNNLFSHEDQQAVDQAIGGAGAAVGKGAMAALF